MFMCSLRRPCIEVDRNDGTPDSDGSIIYAIQLDVKGIYWATKSRINAEYINFSASYINETIT